MNKYLVPSLLRELEDMRDFFGFDVDNFFKPEKKETSGLSVYEDDNAIYIEASLPGISTENIDISCDNGIIWIKGEKKEEKKDVKYHMKSSENFSYRIPLPHRIDEKTITDAEYKDGILKIIFPKNKEKKPKKIQIRKK